MGIVMATLRRLPPAEITDDEWNPCDPAGDETDDVPGVVICFRRTPEPERRWWQPAKAPGRPLALVLTRQLDGEAREYRLNVAPGGALFGPFGRPDDWLGPWPDGPLRLSYPDGADGYQVAVADLADPSVLTVRDA